MKTLSTAAARRTIGGLAEHLGKADRTRVEQLLALIGPDGRIRLGDALQMLYPEQARETALTAFRQLRSRIKAAAEDAGVRLALEADTQTRTAPDQRWCWFEGDDGAATAATAYAKGESAGVERLAQSAVEPTEVRNGKSVIRYFVSYAHADKAMKESLLELLEPNLGLAKQYVFERWQDGDILIGEDWHDTIQSAIARCHFGLLLVSPSFLNRRYIKDHELPAFVAPDPSAPAPGKRAMPVALRRVPFEGRHDLLGLQHLQVFHDKDGKAFAERIGEKRHAFAQALYQQILSVLDRSFAATPSAANDTPARPRDDIETAMRKEMDERLRSVFYVQGEGYAGTIDKLDPTAHEPAGERQDAVQFLEEWVRNPKSQPYCALLGETGMGKTTTCMALTRALLDARVDNAGIPQPIYLDLRLLGDRSKLEPELKNIIAAILRGSGRSGETETALTADEVIRLVRQEGALAIFDGLDEVLVHLSLAAGQRFTREIFRILPPNVIHGRTKAIAPGVRGKLLVTCRTHYFRTLRDQKTHLTAQDRNDIGADDYRTFILLPFTEDQIRNYFRHSLPDEDPDRLLATIGAVHNLSELAERPYTLSLIARHIGQIERWKLEGRRVTGVDLYRHMVLSWLERDTGKHQLTPGHKQQLMEHFAAALWRSGRRSWAVGEVEQWLIDFFETRPALAAHYQGRDRELLKEDLRTATFLVREGEADFRFAHTSLQEFFVAAHLHRALKDGRDEAWDLPRPSRETLDFLGQMLVGNNDPRPQATLRGLRDVYRPRISELAFAYVLLAQSRGYPAPSPAGFHLDGADLKGWTIEGAPVEPLLNLRGASLRGADLTGARIIRVDLSEADLTSACLARAELHDGRAGAARFVDADLTGTLFRGMSLDEADFTGAQLHRTQWLRCRLPGVRGLGASPPAALLALCEPRPDGGVDATTSARLAVLDGHQGSVWSCVFAPDGKRLASAGSDGTVRLWDVASGEVLAVLRGHENGAWACAFAPDGRRLASAGEDGTVRLWDAASAEALAVLRGHESGIKACAFAPDGKRLASASSDGTVRLWDAASGEALAVLRGHEKGAWACTFAPDGKRLASADGDGTVRLWDAASGEALAVLRGHENGVWACTFAPDGKRLASASSDGTVRLWDAASGEALAVLRGHANGALACAFAPDGKRLASAGSDGTVRLWGAVSGEALAVLRGHEFWVWACAFAPDGKRLASAGSDGTMRLWDAASGEALAVLRGHAKGVWTCALAPDGKRLASAGDDGTVRLWDAASGEALAVLRGHANGVRACTFAPDGKRLASAGDDGTVRLWDTASGEALAVLRGHANRVRGCAFAPDGKRVASAGDDSTVRLWDTASGEALAVLRGHEKWVFACAFAPDGGRLASAGDDGTVRLWDAASGDALAVLRGHEMGVRDCAFAPDGKRLASAGSDGTVRLWDAVSGEALAVLRGHDNWVWACAFAPDGKRLASAGSDGTVRLWDAASGDALAVLRGHQGGVSACTFAPDGKCLASAGDDGTMRLWDAASGQEPGFRVHMFENGAWASIDLARNRVIQIGGDAWRWLGWLRHDPKQGLIRYPAEIFGPPPVSRLDAGRYTEKNLHNA